jgi:hypothetical protein
VCESLGGRLRAYIEEHACKYTLIRVTLADGSRLTFDDFGRPEEVASKRINIRTWSRTREAAEADLEAIKEMVLSRVQARLHVLDKIEGQLEEGLNTHFVGPPDEMPESGDLRL